MAKYPNLILGVTLSALAVYQLERPSLERVLPEGISMTDCVDTDSFGNRITVAKKLARLGAFVDFHGKIATSPERKFAFGSIT